ncbi:MFS transporter [Streptomyces tuirus]|uniref:MFS transporter n=1 Tax=Streptomyces tuirus TaxID=68278 RepID=A0A941FMQ0_9ACTN|nr:MFS transporter [Streptomyces tuirus]
MTDRNARPERITRGLIASSFIDSMGNGLFLAGSVLYLTRVVDLSNAQVTFGLTVAGLIGFLTTVPVSMIGDRIGAGRLLVILQFWRLAGFVGYAFVGGFAQFMVVVAFIALGDRVAQPVLQTVVGEAVGDERRVRTMAWIRSTRNAGLTAGALLTSLAVTADTPWSYRAVILGDAATFLASGLLLWGLRLPGGRAAKDGRTKGKTEGQTDGRTKGRTDGSTKGRTDGQTDVGSAKGPAPRLRPWTLLRSLAGNAATSS